MISLVSSGSFEKTTSFLDRIKNFGKSNELRDYGELAVKLLEDATPEDTGETASSWDYNVIDDKGVHYVNIYNNNVVDGVNVAVLLQYGHATRNGGYVDGDDFINPAIDEAFDEMCDGIWREVGME